MGLQDLISQYTQIRTKVLALQYASYMINWDSETEAPLGCFDVRGQMEGALGEESFKLLVDPKTRELIVELLTNESELEKDFAIELKKTKKDIEKIVNIPKDEYVAYIMLLSKAAPIWRQAKNESNFELFAPVLEEIVEHNKKLTKYFETETLKGYDCLLDSYEEGATQVFYDNFFDKLRTELVPFVLEVAKKKIDYVNPLNGKVFPIENQKILSRYMMDCLCFDHSRGLIKESEHPFTSGFGSTDVRVTTHYYHDNFLSSLFSVIHELGHATYELQCDPKYDLTFLSGGTSMAMHESQSRMYENIIGRSYAFWERHYPIVQSLFPVLTNLSLKDFYEAVNEVKCSLIRVEADELTYSIHIMIRYEIEKKLFSGTLAVKDLPKTWNKLVKEYLGIDVPNDAQGVLQDIHWSGGSFGYFPTYAYGSAISSQIYHYMSKDLDIDKILASGKLTEINEWLKEHVHKYAASKTTSEILEQFNEDFNPKYYIEYLKNKYSI